MKALPWILVLFLIGVSLFIWTEFDVQRHRADDLVDKLLGKSFHNLNLEEQVADLEAEIAELNRDLYSTEISVLGARNFCWGVREALDSGHEQYALECFREVMDYDFTSSDREIWQEQFRPAHVRELLEPLTDEEEERCLRAYLLSHATGLALQIGHQCDNWQPVYEIVSWAYTNAPETFDASYNSPIPDGVYVLNFWLHHCLFALAENSTQTQDLDLVRQIFSEIPIEQPIFVGMGGWDAPEVFSADVQRIPRLPSVLRPAAEKRVLAEWEYLRQDPVFEPELLDDKTSYDSPKTHRQVLRGVDINA